MSDLGCTWHPALGLIPNQPPQHTGRLPYTSDPAILGAREARRRHGRGNELSEGSRELVDKFKAEVHSRGFLRFARVYDYHREVPFSHVTCARSGCTDDWPQEMTEAHVVECF